MTIIGRPNEPAAIHLEFLAPDMTPGLAVSRGERYGTFTYTVGPPNSSTIHLEVSFDQGQNWFPSGRETIGLHDQWVAAVDMAVRLNVVLVTAGAVTIVLFK